MVHFPPVRLSTDDPTPSQVASDKDDNLFANNPHHVLHNFLPGETDHTYNLRSRITLSLTVKIDCNNFLNRLFRDIY